MTPEQCHAHLLDALRPLAAGLVAFEPDAELHEVLVHSRERIPRLSQEGARLVADLAELARVKAAMLRQLEFSSTTTPAECADSVATARETVCLIAWQLWAVVTASGQRPPDLAPPGRPVEAVLACGAIALEAYRRAYVVSQTRGETPCDDPLVCRSHRHRF